jgi:hypothetical protein
MIAIPENNIVVFSILPRWENSSNNALEKRKDESFFYKIIMEKGDVVEKTKDKIREIEEALINLNFSKDPLYKDKRDLKYSPFQYAIRKMPFLRILRKSFVGLASAEDSNKWIEESSEILEKSKI